MPTYEHILYENRGPVVLITLNRPERLNAWTQRMENEFIDAIEVASADPGVGCIVVHGHARDHLVRRLLVEQHLGGRR